MNEMEEALAAIEGQLPEFTAPETDGFSVDATDKPTEDDACKNAEDVDKTVIAIQLTAAKRLVKFQHVTQLTGRSTEDRIFGVAVALQNGRCIGANPVYFHWDRQRKPVVSPCVLAECERCGSVTALPYAVFDCKDEHRASDFKNLSGFKVLDKGNGTCGCGGHWGRGTTAATEMCKALVDKTLAALDNAPAVGEFLPPATFAVLPSGANSLECKWEWLQGLIAPNVLATYDHEKHSHSTKVLFNEAFWFGFGDPAASGLFFPDRIGGRVDLGEYRERGL